MAKSTKRKSKSEKSKPSNLDEASIVDEVSKVEDTVVDDEILMDLPDDENRPTESPDVSDDVQSDIEDVDVTSEEVVESDVEQTPRASETSKTVASGSGGFLALLLGGLCAGVIGYGIATYGESNGDDLGATIAAQADQIARLEAQIADIPPVVDLTDLRDEIDRSVDTNAASMTELSDTVAAQLAALDERLLEVEKRPSGDGTLSSTALDAYQRELDALRAELDAQQENVMSAAAQAEADLAAARAEAERLEQEALMAAEAAASRAALNRVATAVDTGAPFATALTDLGADVSAELVAAAETGVVTNAQLVADFPAVARAGLATARSEGLSGESGGLSGFLRRQLDVRSTTPQVGTTPDAILSRAEASVKEGRVADALAEIETLPEVVRAEMSTWIAQASERADVLNAIATLSETLN